jgi:hypothetical protein
VQGQEWGRSDDIGEVLRKRLWDRMSQRGQDRVVVGVLLLQGEETKGTSMKGSSVIHDDV